MSVHEAESRFHWNQLEPTSTTWSCTNAINEHQREMNKMGAVRKRRGRLKLSELFNVGCYGLFELITIAGCRGLSFVIYLCSINMIQSCSLKCVYCYFRRHALTKMNTRDFVN